MKKTLKLCGLYLLVTLVVAVGVVFLVPLSVSANNEDDEWLDTLPPVADNHLLDIVGNLMNLHYANVTADLALTTGEQAIDLNANIALQAEDDFANLAVAGDLALRINDFNAALHVTYLDNRIYADFNHLHLAVGVTDLMDGLPTLLALFGVEFTMPDMGDLDVSAILDLLEDYTETDNGNGLDIVLTVAGCAVELTCDANFNLQRAVIPALTFGDITLAGEIGLTYTATDPITVPDYAYVDVPQLIKLFGDLVPMFNSPFAFTGNATIFATTDGVRQLDNYLSADFGRLAVATRNGLLDQFALDILVKGQGEVYNTLVGNREQMAMGAYFNGNNEDGGVHINFDGLQLFCAKANLADTYAALQGLLGLFVGEDILHYTDLFYFNDNNDMTFDATVLGDLLGDMSTTDIVTMIDTYLPYLQGLTLTADNVLTISLANDLLDLELRPAVDGGYELSIRIGLAAQNREIVATFTLQSIDDFVGEPEDKTGYLDVSDISILLNAVKNTVQHKEFYFTGTVAVSIIGINVDVPVEISINNTDPERGLVVAVHIAIPYNTLTSLGIGNLRLLDSAPDAAGKTQTGYNRDVYLYYQQGHIYLYRTEQVKLEQGILWNKKTLYSGAYEKAVKLTMAEFMDDALNWLLDWGFGFSESIMQQLTDAITKNAGSNEPLNYGDIIHGFQNNNGRFDIVLNLGEITHNSDLKDFTVTIDTADNADSETEITAVGLDMQINVGISIVLKTTGDGLVLTTGDGVADVTTATNWMDNYAFADGETWHKVYNGVPNQADWQFYHTGAVAA